MASPPPDQVRLAQIYGRKYGVDPRVLLAIGGHETQWGRLGAGRQGYTLGYGATDSGTIGKYAGVKNQYRYAASTLASWGVHGIQDLIAGKAARYASDPHWEAGVASLYKSLGGPLPPMPAGVGASPALPSPAPQAAAAAPNFVASPQVLATLRRSLASRQTADPMAQIDLPEFVPNAPPPVVRSKGPAAASGRGLAAPEGSFAATDRGKLIGTPYAGTHKLGNWESDNAVDISLAKGTPIYAPADGYIGGQIGPLGSGNPRFAGNRLHLVTKGNEFYFAHLSRLAVKAGQQVHAGQLLGYSGSANGVEHLHIGSRKGDPRKILGV